MENDNGNSLVEFLKLRLKIQAWAKVGFTVVSTWNRIHLCIIIY